MDFNDKDALKKHAEKDEEKYLLPKREGKTKYEPWACDITFIARATMQRVLFTHGTVTVKEFVEIKDLHYITGRELMEFAYRSFDFISRSKILINGNEVVKAAFCTSELPQLKQRVVYDYLSGGDQYSDDEIANKLLWLIEDIPENFFVTAKLKAYNILCGYTEDSSYENGWVRNFKGVEDGTIRIEHLTSIFHDLKNRDKFYFMDDSGFTPFNNMLPSNSEDIKPSYINTKIKRVFENRTVSYSPPGATYEDKKTEWRNEIDFGSKDYMQGCAKYMYCELHYTKYNGQDEKTLDYEEIDTYEDIVDEEETRFKYYEDFIKSNKDGSSILKAEQVVHVMQVRYQVDKNKFMGQEDKTLVAKEILVPIVEIIKPNNVSPKIWKQEIIKETLSAVGIPTTTDDFVNAIKGMSDQDTRTLYGTVHVTWNQSFGIAKLNLDTSVEGMNV